MQTIQIAHDLTVNRLGFGAMRITGKGVWGEPADRDEALRVLRRLPRSASISSTRRIRTART